MKVLITPLTPYAVLYVAGQHTGKLLPGASVEIEGDTIELKPIIEAELSAHAGILAKARAALNKIEAMISTHSPADVLTEMEEGELGDHLSGLYAHFTAEARKAAPPAIDLPPAGGEFGGAGASDTFEAGAPPAGATANNPPSEEVPGAAPSQGDAAVPASTADAGAQNESPSTSDIAPSTDAGSTLDTSGN